MKTAIRWQRSSAALISALALAAATLAATGPLASASPVQPAAPAASIATTAPVTNDAWVAGRRAYGTEATAADAVRAYWTPERMRSATPIEDSPQYLAAMKKFQHEGGPASVPDTSAGRQVFEPALGRVKAPPSGFGTQAHNPNFAVGQVTARTSGKVFFSQAGGTSVCSATVINSEGQDTVWSAAHCMHGGAGGGWFSNWVFVPNYDDDLANPRPYGTWAAGSLHIRAAWANNTDFSQDFGVAIMATLNGKHIVSELGGHGLIANAGTNVWTSPFGYPSESPFDGGNLWQCWGNSAPEYGSGQTIQVQCDMTRGSSGGGWLYNWDGSLGYLNGINSRIDRIVNPRIMYSPYFDNDALDLFNATRNL